MEANSIHSRKIFMYLDPANEKVLEHDTRKFQLFVYNSAYDAFPEEIERITVAPHEVTGAFELIFYHPEGIYLNERKFFRVVMEGETPNGEISCKIPGRAFEFGSEWCTKDNKCFKVGYPAFEYTFNNY